MSSQNPRDDRSNGPPKLGPSQPQAADDATRFAPQEGEDLHGDSDGSDFDLSEPAARESESLLSVLGEYLLLEPIGAGGMGQVFRAEHRTMNREVAVKILSQQIAGQPQLREQFFAEIRAVAKLMHGNIVTAFDAGSAGQIHYLVMELVDGEILSGRVRSLGPLSSSQAVSVLEQTADALAYAHSLGIVHRDIKPSNMMLTPQGKVKILDFGLARFGLPDLRAQNKKMFIGTPEYMSPEQIENPDSADARSDLYSLGATLFFLLTGKTMFSGEKMQVARAQVHQKPPPLFLARPDVDLRLDAVFQKLVAKRPSDRYANARELLDSLKSLNLTSDASVRSHSLEKGAYRLASDSPTSVAFDKSTLAKQSQIVAIDFGTIATTAAIYDPKLGPQIVLQPDGISQQLRNMIWSSGERVKIGAEAVELRNVEPEKIFHSVQRWIGGKPIVRPFGGRTVPVEVLLAAMLRQAIENCKSVSDGSSSAIVTVPACYDQQRRRALRRACNMAGIELIQLLDKPLAASLAWLDIQRRLTPASDAAKLRHDTSLLVIHLGGSALESTVVRVAGATVRQAGTCGHWQYATQRWQSLLTEYFVSTLKGMTGKSIREDVAAATRLQRTVEVAFDRLTRSPKVDVRFSWRDAVIEQKITQEGLVKTSPELARVLEQSITSACATAEIGLQDIDCVLFSGSMMQMRAVQKLALNLFGRDVPSSTLSKSDIALGAAIQSKFSCTLTEDGDEPRAVGSAAYDIALLTQSAGKPVGKPRILLSKGTQTPASIARTIRSLPLGEGGDVPAFKLIESASFGDGSWVRHSSVNAGDAFPQRPENDSLQLRLEVDESGILESSLSWPGGNKLVRIPIECEAGLSEKQLAAWAEWLETTVLCSEL